MVFIVASLAGLSLVTPSPAAAHVCVKPVEVPVGKTSAITVGVPAEVESVVRVAIEVPAGFDLDEARAAKGWTSSVDGSAVTYAGGHIAPMQCAYFTMTGTATRKAKLVFAVTATDAAGATTEYGPGVLGAQEVYAGLSAFPGDGGGSGVNAATIAGVVLVAGGLVAAAALFVRRRAGRRSPPAR